MSLFAKHYKAPVDNSDDTSKLDTAVKLLAGFCANPAVFAPSPTCGWTLANCAEDQLVEYALSLAGLLLDKGKS